MLFRPGLQIDIEILTDIDISAGGPLAEHLGLVAESDFDNTGDVARRRLHPAKMLSTTN